jgi:hypothetical protein
MDKKNYKEQRHSQYRLDSKDRLAKILKKKIQTTMIGALSSIEEHFGFLWSGENANNDDMRDLYHAVRSEILDKGNSQARNIDAELAQYDVEWLRYQINMPVITKKSEE